MVTPKKKRKEKTTSPHVDADNAAKDKQKGDHGEYFTSTLPLPQRKYGKKKVSRKRKYLSAFENLVILDENNDSESSVENWIKIGEQNLYNTDAEHIESGNWLNDRIMNAAQQLVVQEFPLWSGLIDTVALPSQDLPTL